MAVGHVRATIDDLYRVEGKAELIGGRIVHLMATGDLPSEVAENISSSLRSYCKQSGRGKSKGDNVAYVVPELSSERESFSPDASYHEIPPAANRMRFLEGPPLFAVEVRSENDYTRSAEREMAAKRDDYFEAGTLVVWDVDPLAKTVAMYVGTQPVQMFRAGDIANAEPAVPGWTMPVDEIFAD